MNITYANGTDTAKTILVDGVEVGYIERDTIDVPRMIPGSMLRSNIYRRTTVYRVILRRRHFVAAPLTITMSQDFTRLAAAKAYAEELLPTLTLKG